MNVNAGLHGENDADERAPTVPSHFSSYGWAEDYLNEVPFEDMNTKLLTFVCKMIPLVSRSNHAVGELLLSLPRETTCSYEDYNKDDKLILDRMAEGDVTVLSEVPEFFDQQEIAAFFAYLYSYARSGEGPGRTPAESRQGIEDLLRRYEDLTSMIPASLRAEMGVSFTWLNDTLAAARARWATDNGKGVATDDFAALAGVKSKTIANLLAAKTVPIDADGRIPAAAALSWLSTRKGFVPSSWQTWFYEPHVSDVGAAPLTGEQVFLPLDGDGNPFLPSLARRSKAGVLRYAIGEKKEPMYVEDYWEALASLARMATPRWRRPNPDAQGAGWGLVTAQDGWRRYARTDLERMIVATQAGEG